jgi:hypothetical protein
MNKVSAKLESTLGHAQNVGQINAAEELIERFISWRAAQEDFAAASANSITANESANRNTSLTALRAAQELVVTTTKNLMKSIDEYNKPKWPLGTRLAQKESGEVKPYFYVANPAERIRLEQFRSYLATYLKFVRKLILPAKASGIGPRTFKWTKFVSNRTGTIIDRLEGNYRQNLSVRKIRKNGTQKLNLTGAFIYKRNGTPEILPAEYISIPDLKRLLIEILPERTINKYKRQLGLANANNNAAAEGLVSLFAGEGEGGKRKTRRRRHSRRRHTRRN